MGEGKKNGHTSTGPVVDELQARRAVTLKANRHVFAEMRAAPVVHQALVDICGA